METPDQNEGQAPSELEMLKRRADTLGVPYSNNIGVETLRARINEKLGSEQEQEQDQSGDEAEDETGQGGELSGSAEGEVNGFEAAAAVAAQKDKSTEQKLTAPAQAQAAAVIDETAIAAYLSNLGLTPELLAAAAALAKDPGQAPITNLGSTAGTKAKKKSLRSVLHERHMKLIRIRVTCMNPAKKELKGEFFTVANKHLGNVTKFVPFGEATENGYHVPEIIYKMMQRRKYVSITTVKDKGTGYERQNKTLVREFAIEVLPPLTESELQSLATAQIAAGSLDA